MKINFENQLVFLSAPAADLSGSTLDGKGKMQMFEKALISLEEKYQAVSNESARLGTRQKEDVSNFLDFTNKELMESIIINFPIIQSGMIDTVPLFLNGKPLNGSTTITLSGATEDFEISPVKKMFKETANIYLGDLGEDLPYTFVSVKIDQPKLVSSFSIHRNLADLKLIKWKNSNQVWEDYGSPPGFIQYQNVTFLDIETNEISFYVRNNKINDRYYCDLKVIPFYKTYDFTGTSFFWDKDLPINGVYAIGFEVEMPFYIELKIVIDKREYNVQLPATNNALSRMEVETYTSNGSNTETIFKCPYPVDLTESLSLLKDISNSNESTVLTGWSVSLDKLTWLPESQAEGLIYGTDYSKKSKFTYFKVPGYYENAYLLYKLNKNVNSNWFITNNEVLFFNGSGISINNKLGSSVKISGKAYCFGSNSSDVFPLGVLGID